MAKPIRIHSLCTDLPFIHSQPFTIEALAQCIVIHSKTPWFAFITENDDGTYVAEGLPSLIKIFQTVAKIEDKFISPLVDDNSSTYVHVSEEKGADGKTRPTAESNSNNLSILKDGGDVTLGKDAPDTAILRANSLFKTADANSATAVQVVGTPSQDAQVHIGGTNSATASDQATAVAVAYGDADLSGKGNSVIITPNTNPGPHRR